jgi:uncharacterized protein (TIRG00374 family)
LRATPTTAAGATGAATAGDSGPWRARARIASVSVAVLLALVLLAYSLRGIEWREVGLTIAAANLGLLAVTGAIASSTLFLRAIRWRILLNAEGNVSVADAFWATSAGLFGNNFLPARAGELVRTYMISARSGLGNAYVLATALSERIADAVVLVAVSAIVLLALDSPPGWLAEAATPFAIVGLLGAAAIAVLPFLGPVGRTLIARAPLPRALQARLVAVLGRALDGMRAFHDARRLTGFLALATLIWGLDVAGTVVGAAALGLHIEPAAAFLLIAGLSVGSALPSTPGYIGIYQFVAVSVLTPFGFSRAEAIAFILVTQALGYVVIGCWGSLGLLRARRVAKP